MDKPGLLLSAFVVLTLLSALELVVVINHLDAKAIAPVLYFADGDINYTNPEGLFRHADDSRLIELIPSMNTTCISCGHGLEGNKDTAISINRLGFRGKEVTIKKSYDVFRIIVVGGSNTFGISVNDNETYPYLLEKQLNSINPGHFEVWNCGIPGYSLIQKVEYAKMLKKYEPDMIMIEDTYSNRGRRVFSIYDKDYLLSFDEDNILFIENLPLLISDSKFLVSIHRELIKISGIYRWSSARMNNFVLGRLRISDCISAYPYTNCPDKMTEGRFSDYADEKGEEALGQYLSAEPNAFVFNPVDSMFCPPDQRHFSLCNMPGEYKDIHPPSYVYRYYADELSDYIIRTRIRKDG